MNPAPPPQDATVLVGAGADRSAWQMMDGAAVTWPMNSGELSTGKGMIRTRAEFTDYQLHVEFATPKEVKGNSQERGNSGVFLNGKFEIQVLDSYQNRTYADGSAAAMYGQYPPLVNASRPPGEWQAYDIVFGTGRGKTYSNAGLLDSARKKTTFYEHQEEEAGSQVVRVWGDTAVVTALLWIKGTSAGTTTDYKLWFSDTYVRTPGGWRY